jgi:hypothetical protein
MIGLRLFLPESWTSDRARLKRARNSHVTLLNHGFQPALLVPGTGTNVRLWLFVLTIFALNSIDADKVNRER